MNDEASGPSGITPEAAPAEPAAADAGRARSPCSPRLDPWAHRRAEPRTFAFIWTVFLFIATLSAYAVTATTGLGGYDIIRPAARQLLSLVGAGLVLVWPMVRLAQEPDRRPIAGPLLDLIVILVPVQAIVWPQNAWWLNGWPLSVVAAVGAFIAAWAFVIASLISISHQTRPRLSPGVCMLILLGLLAGAHMPMIAGIMSSWPADAPVNGARSSWLLSPIAGVFELTRDRTWNANPAQVFPGHWRMIGMLGGIGLALWMVAFGIRARARRPVA